jgi:tetratricopeptide (TPR) repeat protein
VSLWEQATGPDSLETARALAGLARVLGAFERWDDAVAAAKRALTNYERHLGPGHPEVGRMLSLVGNHLFQRGDFLEAQSYLERALSIVEPSGPETRRIYYGLGLVSLKRGYLTQAALHFRRAIAVAEEFLGPISSFAGAAQYNLSDALRRLGRYEEAREACERAVHILVDQHAVGPDHPVIGAAWDCLGFVSYDAHRYDEAIVRFGRAVAISERASPDMPEHALALAHLSEAYLAKGRARDALPLLTRAVAVMESHQVVLGDRAELRFALARALWTTGSDRKRALTLAADARDDFAAVGAGRKDDLERLDEWLAGHRL